MTITSINYLIFCVAAILLFIVFPKKYRWISLLISSGVFYWIAGDHLVYFILFTSFTTWFGGRQLDKLRSEQDSRLEEVGKDKAQKKAIKKEYANKRRTAMLIVLVLNIGLLVVFKLFNYFTEAYAALVSIFAGSGQPLDTLTVVMPLGISYYTFSNIGYLLDLYWKRYRGEENFARFLLFNCFFVRIMQGPISRYNRLGQELRKPELHFTWSNFVIGMESILLGCFKKLVIADRVSIYVGNTMTADGLPGAIYLLGMIMDGIQIYTDFSGYMDIVSGVARMFDIELEQNFNHPFMAANVPEFWRRWHMTLGGWFKDYVYYPISVSKTVKKLNKKTVSWKSKHLKIMVSLILPVMTTWILTGLWHGTGIGYVMWGLYYGILILFSSTFSDDIQNLLSRLHVNTECFSYQIFRTIKIFCIFMGGRFLAATYTLHHKGHIIKRILLHFVGFSFTDYGLDAMNFLIVFLGVVLLFAITAIEENGENIFVWFNKQNRVFCGIVICLFCFMILILGIFGSGVDTDFMYQQF